MASGPDIISFSKVFSSFLPSLIASFFNLFADRFLEAFGPVLGSGTEIDYSKFNI